MHSFSLATPCLIDRLLFLLHRTHRPLVLCSSCSASNMGSQRMIEKDVLWSIGQVQNTDTNKWEKLESTFGVTAATEAAATARTQPSYSVDFCLIYVLCEGATI